MIEILFKAKRVDNGEEVEGYYIVDKWGDANKKEIYGILQDRLNPPGDDKWVAVPVDPETVRQFTGLYDKNGRRIFMADILKDKNGELYAVRRYAGCYKIIDKYGNVIVPAQRAIKYKCVEVIGKLPDNGEWREIEYEQ